MTEYIDTGTARVKLTPSAVEAYYVDVATARIALTPAASVEARTITDAATAYLTLTPAGEDLYAKFLPTLIAFLKRRWTKTLNPRWSCSEVQGHWRVTYFGKGSGGSS